MAAICTVEKTGKQEGMMQLKIINSPATPRLRSILNALKAFRRLCGIIGFADLFARAARPRRLRAKEGAVAPETRAAPHTAYSFDDKKEVCMR
jgi:hypothetical protein